MKRLFILVSLIAAAAAFNPAGAQVRVSINIGSQPAWGPAGYDYAEYYYLPEIDMYYYIPARQYIYLHHGRWVRTTYIPAHYRNFDFYRTYKVVINERDPYRYHDRYRTQYARYRYTYNQPVLRDARYRDYDRRDNDGWNDRRDNDHRNSGWNDRRDNDHRNDGWNDRRDNDHRNNGWNDRRDNDNRNNGWNTNRGNNGRGNDNRDHQRGNNGRGNGNGNGNGKGHGRGH